MNKLIVYFLFMVVSSGVCVGIVAGGGGIVTADLAENMTAVQTSVDVSSTTGFLDEDYVIIGAEKIFYSDKDSDTFLECTRGYDSTTASTHAATSKVYTVRASAINNALGFDIGAVQDSMGWATFIAIPFLFFVRTIPLVIKSATPLLTGDLAIIAWFVYAMIGGFVITLALTIIGGIRTK